MFYKLRAENKRLGTSLLPTFNANIDKCCQIWDKKELKEGGNKERLGSW